MRGFAVLLPLSPALSPEGRGRAYAGRGKAQGGYALLAALIAVALVSLAAAAAVGQARQETQREREAQLLWVGNQIRQALWQYSQVPVPQGVPRYPARLEELLEDQRTPVIRRHLRRLYADPFTNQADWVLEKQGDRIVGVHSRSTAKPIRSIGFGPGNETFAVAASYEGWHFMATTVTAPAAAGPGAGTVATFVGGAVPGGVPSGDGTGSPSSEGDGSTPANLPPPDPNFQARLACYQEFVAPKALCTNVPPPQGTDLISCMKYYATQYNQCIAGLGN